MAGDAASLPRVGVVVPIRSFVGAKARLASHLDEGARAAALRLMADRVLDAASPMPVVVVTSAPEVRAWAATRGAEVLDDPGTLDAAAETGKQHFAGLGAARVVVVHADLPHARSLAVVASDEGDVAVLVPCHRDDGTNVVSVPATSDFRFAYGPGSFRRHVAEAHRVGLDARVVRAPDLVVDVDTPDDLAHLDASCPSR